MRKEHIAHITIIGGKRVDQTVREHSRRVAEYAAECLRSSGLYNTGYLAGLLHDCGKTKDEMTAYLEEAFCGKNPVRGSVNHTFAARYVLTQSLRKIHISTIYVDNLFRRMII